MQEKFWLKGQFIDSFWGTLFLIIRMGEQWLRIHFIIGFHPVWIIVTPLDISHYTKQFHLNYCILFFLSFNLFLEKKIRVALLCNIIKKVAIFYQIYSLGTSIKASCKHMTVPPFGWRTTLHKEKTALYVHALSFEKLQAQKLKTTFPKMFISGVDITD